MVKSPRVLAVGRQGSIPGPGRPHMRWSNEACEPQLLKPTSPRASAQQQEEPLQREAHTRPLSGLPTELEEAQAE